MKRKTNENAENNEIEWVLASNALTADQCDVCDEEDYAEITL